MAESETNSLTMKLLALSSYCEGPKAAEIKAVISQLPVAAYKERVAADQEVSRLRRENADLKQRMAQAVLGTRPPLQPPPTPRSYQSSREEGRSTSSGSSSDTLSRDHRLTPPHPRELFPDGYKAPMKRARESSPPPSVGKRLREASPPPPLKRLRESSIPGPPPPHAFRRRAVCTGCFQTNGLCDGKSECSCCRARSYGCEYNECWDGRSCLDSRCTRLHPDQWDRNEEPKRMVKLKGRGP